MKLLVSSLVGVALASEGVNPVTRVVELLDGLRTQAEKDGKKEEQLFEKFLCWGKTIIKTKTASNEAAAKRIKTLETYIADIEAGRIEFTSERVDLEKELAELNTAIEEATALRKKENDEFLAAEDEMKKTSAALDEAIIVLKDATEGHEEGVLVQVQRVGLSSGDGLAASEEKASQLARVSELGQRVLTKGDALFLQKLLSGEVPKPDWKKLNRKATFKMAYKARSFKIQDVLAKLKQTVDINLKEARDSEAKAVKDFEKLMGAKKKEKESAEDALLKGDGENGARGQTKDESQAEVDALKKQVSNDEKFIEQTQKSLDEKTGEWKDRSVLRAGEISAISKAIYILSNDDAKDLMTRSHASQGYLFLQVDRIASRRDAAVAAIRQAAASSQGARLSALALMVASQKGSHFTEVMAAIDKMVTTLKKEEECDLKRKETCESSRDEQTREAAVQSRTMDELTEGITKLEGEIADINAEIAEKQDTIKATETALKEAAADRKAENEEWAASDADDKLAKETVGRAKDVLANFYADNNLMLVQARASKPGEAPAPPPETWEDPYGGKTDESTSIIAILEMIGQDIEKDILHAKEAEDKAQAEFDAFETKSNEQISDLKSDISDLEGTRSDKESSASDKTEERTTASEELNAVMKTISDERPGCDFFEVNYPNRLKNRQIEIDGLIKAKAILQGAEFNAGPDPNREMKPGDAFLQRRR